MKANKVLVEALNVLIWKLPIAPEWRGNDASSIAEFIIAELEDKGIIGLAWNKQEECFELHRRR